MIKVLIFAHLISEKFASLYFHVPFFPAFYLPARFCSFGQFSLCSSVVFSLIYKNSFHIVEISFSCPCF